MPYVEGRVVHDADSHLMELNDCLDPYLSESLRARYHETPVFRSRLKKRPNEKAEARAKHADPEFRTGVSENIMLRKNLDAHGAFLAEDRPSALDLMGFASQLIFTTHSLGNFGLDQGDDMALCYATASAHNRMMTDFCQADRRLLATAYIPLEDMALARSCAEEAIRLAPRP